MDMNIQVVLPLLGTLGGVAMLLGGLAKRGQAADFKTVPCLPPGSAPRGARAFITGKAHSPASANAPVSGKPCVFFTMRVDTKVRDHSGDNSSSVISPKYRWQSGRSELYGAFFVRDASGAALVLPALQSLDLKKAAETASNDTLFSQDADATRTTEHIIREDEAVTALGTPQPLSELIAYLRQNTQYVVSPDLLGELLRLEGDPGAAGLPCFFGAGLERVTDQAHAEYVAGTQSSAAFLLPAGVIVAAIGAFFLFQALRHAAPPPPF